MHGSNIVEGENTHTYYLWPRGGDKKYCVDINV